MNDDSGGIIETSIIAGSALVLLLIAVFVLAILSGLFLGSTGEEMSFDPSTESSIKISNDDEPPEGFGIDATTGSAVSMADGGYVAGSEPDNWTAGNWSICTTVQLDPDANEQANYNLFAYENESITVEYRDQEWRASHIQDNESAVAESPAPDAKDQTSLCSVWHNETEELSLIVDGSVEDIGALSSGMPDRSVSLSWDGWIDEVRLIDGQIAGSSAETYADNPVAVLGDEQHDARYMLDEGSGNETQVYYQDTTATVYSDWTDGVDGPDLVEGEDYYLSDGPIELTVADDGRISDAPVAYVSWTGNLFANVGEGIIANMTAVLSLLVLGILAMAASVVMRVFGSGFGGR